MLKKLDTIYFKLITMVLMTIGIMVVIPFAGLSRQVQEDFWANIDNHVIHIMQNLEGYLHDETLTPAMLEDILSTDSMGFDLSPQLPPIDFTEKQLERLNSNHPVVYKESADHLLAVTKCADQYAIITFTTISASSRLWARLHYSALFSLMLGIALILLCGRNFVQPVLTLDSAAKRVAAGDLKVQVVNKHRKDELGSLITSFNSMVQELGSVELFRNSFISDISHEFKTPLTTISGYAKLLQGDCQEEEREEYAQIIMEEAHHLSILADNILTLNRLENHVLSTPEEPIKVDEQIRKTLTTYEPTWNKKRIDLQLDLENTTIFGHEALLMRVWANLIDNAIKFSPENAVIKISLHCQNGQIIFKISDQGCGIDLDKQKRIFDKFYKADNSRNIDGNGLGLAIVRRVVEIHSGKISVESIPAHGSIFTVSFNTKIKY